MSTRRKWFTALSFIVLALGIVVAVAGGGSKSAPTGPFNGTAPKLKAATTAAVDNATDSPGLAQPPNVGCIHLGGQYLCHADYVIKEPAGINYGLETILPSTGVFKYAFTYPKLNSMLVQVSGPTTSVGGKTSTSKLFDLECSRREANQIDWDDVTVDGLKQLCTFQQFVNNP